MNKKPALTDWMINPIFISCVLYCGYHINEKYFEKNNLLYVFIIILSAAISTILATSLNLLFFKKNQTPYIIENKAAITKDLLIKNLFLIFILAFTIMITQDFPLIFFIFMLINSIFLVRFFFASLKSYIR